MAKKDFTTPLTLNGDYPNLDDRYTNNGDPYTSVSAAQTALASKLNAYHIGLTVLVADENDPDYPKAKEYWVQPKGTTPETYGLVEKGAGVTDYNDLDNKPTISDGVNTALPIVGNVKVSATTASGETAGVSVTPGLNAGEIEMQFTLPKGNDAYEVYLEKYKEEHSGSTDGAMSKDAWLASLKGADGADGQDGAPGDPGHNPNLGTYLDTDTNKPTTGQAGDYFIVIDTTDQPRTASVWAWNGTAFADTEKSVEDFGLQFATGQPVADVHIKDENGDDDPNAQGVLSAAAGAELAAKINEVNVGSAVSLAAAIALVPQGMKKAGVTVTYYDTQSSKWVAKQYIGDTLSDWNVESLWIDAGSRANAGGLVKNGEGFARVLSKQECVDLGYTVLSGKYLNITNVTVGSTVISSVADLTTAPGNEGNLILKIPIHGGATINFTPGRSTSGFGSLVVDANGLVLWKYIETEETTERTFVAPQTAAYMYYNTPSSAFSFSENLVISETENRTAEEVFKKLDEIGSIDELKTNNKTSLVVAINEVKNIAEGGSAGVRMLEIAGTDAKSSYLFAFQKFAPVSTYTTGTTVVTDASSFVYAGNSNASVLKIEIPTGTNKMIFPGFMTSSGYGSFVTNAQGVVLAVYQATQPSYTFDVVPPDGSKYLYLGMSNTQYNNPDTWNVVFHVEESEVVADIKKAANRKMKPCFFNGRIEVSGFVDDDSKVISSPIYGDFYLECGDGVRVYAAALVNENGEMVNNELLPAYKPNGDMQWAADTRKSYGSCNLPHGYGVVVVLSRTDEGGIKPSDYLLKKFAWLKDGELTTYKPSNEQEGAAFAACRLRAKRLQSVVWKPISKVPARQTYNAKNYLTGSVCLGIPYSGARLYDKYVGLNVTLYTFLSALQNPRSLMYTESLRYGGTYSDYGITYNSDLEGSSYYGMVCSAFVAYTLGLHVVFDAGNTTAYGQMTLVANPTADDIKPFDVLVKNGHVSVVYDVLIDAYGNVKYILWAESVAPLPKITPYTPERFFERLSVDSTSVYRWGGFGSNNDVLAEDGLSEALFDDYQNDLAFNQEIMTFAGDKATFVVGDKIFVNAKKGDYTKVQLYKNDGATPTEITITDLTADSEGWVDVELTSTIQSLGYGKYKARLSDGTNVSDYTYFEAVEMAISCSNGVASFSCNGAVPTYLAEQTEYPSNVEVHQLTAEEIAAGQATVGWTNSSYYVKLFAEGDYGTATKRVLIG